MTLHLRESLITFSLSLAERETSSSCLSSPTFSAVVMFGEHMCMYVVYEYAGHLHKLSLCVWRSGPKHMVLQLLPCNQAKGMALSWNLPLQVHSYKLANHQLLGLSFCPNQRFILSSVCCLWLFHVSDHLSKHHLIFNCWPNSPSTNGKCGVHTTP